MECGQVTTSNKRGKQFCGAPCRKTFNNRRASRGAQLYDMVMEIRFARDRAKKLKLWTIHHRMAGFWREEDKVKRAGRQSWQDPQKVIEQKPYLRSE